MLENTMEVNEQPDSSGKSDPESPSEAALGKEHETATAHMQRPTDYSSGPCDGAGEDGSPVSAGRGETGGGDASSDEMPSEAESTSTVEGAKGDGGTVSDESDGPGRTKETGKSSEKPSYKLSDEHRKMLSEESGISDELIEARGYRTITVKAHLKDLGFSDSQRKVPTLVIPVYSPAGEIATYQSRPNEPRIAGGKPVKYETPKNSRMSLDVNPSSRDDLDDPSVPLFVTEGVKKGDALASHGLTAVALMGVWNWKGTNKKGGKTALADWDQIALEGRQVYITFDSDVMLKPSVYKAMVRLKGFLESRKADVAVIYLPPTEKGGKQGVDDYLRTESTPADLISLATTDLKKPPESKDEVQIPETQSAVLVQYAAKAELFRTPDGTPYIAIPVEVKEK